MRSKRSSEIQFKKSFFKFSFIFFLSLILGLVGRYFIHTQPLDQIVSDKISESEKYKIDVQGVRIKLRQGWLPAVAVFADQVLVVDHSCSGRSLQAKDIFISMDITSLFRSKVKPKSVYITEAHLKFSEKCGSVQKDTPGAPSKEKAPPVKVQVQRSEEQGEFPKALFSIFKKESQTILPPLFDIDEFRVELFRDGKPKLSFHGGMSFRNNGTDFVTNIYPRDVVFQEQELPLSKGLVSLSLSEDAFGAHYETYVREGKASVGLRIENREGYPVELSAKLAKIPISTFSRFLLAETRFNYLWVNCETSLKAPWKKVKGTFFSLEQCHLSGPYGTAKVLQSKTSFEKMKVLEVEFNKIDLDQVIKDKRNIYFSGIFSRFGTLSGALKHSEGRWKFNAMMVNSDVLFSRNNSRELQKVSRLPFKVVSQSSGWHLSLSNVELDQGLMEGKVDFFVDHKMKNGRGAVAFRKIRLQPKIYKLMLNAETSEFSLFGKVGLENGDVSRWEGALASARIAGEKFAFTGLKLEASQINKQKPLLRIVSSSGHFAKESQILSWLKPTVLNEAWINEKALFKELSVKFRAENKETWLWKRGYVRFGNGWQLSSEGSLDISGNLQGWMQWDVPKKSFLRWKYSGLFNKGKWKPEEEKMKVWLKDNNAYLKSHPSIDFVADNKSEMAEDVKAMGKKILEKAKSVLPIEIKKKNKGS